MVAKCANPKCSSQFHYLHLGKLFVIESGGEEHRLNYYWLCEKCCGMLTIEYESGRGITVKAAVVNRARPAQDTDSFEAA
jgi:hypothetical protein